MPAPYRSFDLPVPGGDLHVGQWGVEGPVVLATHGITGTHRSYLALADRLPDNTRLVAPDLRGRGKSNRITGPFGMAAHADDLAAILDHLDVASAVVVGHSMGGAVAVTMAARHPDRVERLVLVDGGAPFSPEPIELPPDQSVEDLVRAAIGPALDRLDMTFPALEAYLDFWRAHPSWQEWTAFAEDAFTYDLVGEPPALRSGVDKAAILADGGELLTSRVVFDAFAALRQPATLLWAERGMVNQLPGLYTEATVAPWRQQVPTLETTAVDGVNHYTVLMGERGGAAVATAVWPTPAR